MDTNKSFPYWRRINFLLIWDFPFLTLYVPCIVTNSINKPTRCTFLVCIYSTIILYTLHVSKDYFVHHQESISHRICSSVQTVQTCLTETAWTKSWYISFNSTPPGIMPTISNYVHDVRHRVGYLKTSLCALASQFK